MRFQRVKILLLVVFAIIFNLLFSAMAYESQRNTEEIMPPGLQKWYEKGDSELYTTSIKPITPKTGIQTGYFFYYGHYIRKPYKIHSKNSNIYINSLDVTLPNKISEDYSHKYWKLKKQNVQLNKEVIDQSELESKICEQIDSYFQHLVKTYNDDEIIVKKLSQFFKDHPYIDSYKIESVYHFGFHITKSLGGLEWWDMTPTGVSDVDKSEEEARISLLIDHWKTRLSNGVYFYCGGSQFWGNVDDLQNIVRIMKSQRSTENKVQSIYKITSNLTVSKYIVYNFILYDYLYVN